MLTWLLIPAALALPAELSRAALGPPQLEGLALSTEAVQWAGGTVLRVEQHLLGLPVLGPRPRVSLDTRLQITAVQGMLLEQSPDTLTPSISASRAAQLAEDGLRIDASPWPSHARLAVLPGQPPQLVWQVQLARLQPFQTWTVLVDAVDGTLVQAELTLQSVDGRVFPESPHFSEPQVLELHNLSSTERLRGTYAEAFSCVDWEIDPKPFGSRDCLSIDPTARPDSKGNYRYEPAYGDLNDPFAEVHAYHHTDRISEWADHRWGIKPLEPMRVLTNFPLTNAFYGDFDGDGVRDTSYGISDDGYNLAYDSDIVYHEYGHAIMRTVAGSMGMGADEIGIDWTSGSLNEGAADVFAMALNGDPLLAEYLGQSDRWDRAIRDLEPDRRCPDDLQSEVHRSGQILGAVGWNLIEILGQEMGAEVLVGALSTWSDETSWAEAGLSLQDATTALAIAGAITQVQAQSARDAIERSGMPDCTRIIDLGQVPGATLTLLNLGLSDEYARFPTGVQLSLRAPVEARAIELQVLSFDGRADGTGWTITIRAGAPVEHLPTRVDGLGLAFAEPVEFDLQIDGAGPRTIRLDEDGPLILEPGEIYYFAISSRNLSREPLDLDYAQIGLAARALVGEEASPEQVGQAGCSVLDGHPNLGWMWLAPVALIRRRGTTRTQRKIN